MTTREILVGIDGSDTSIAALRWAAAEAVQRGAGLHVVFAYDPQWPPTQPQQYAELAAIAHEQAEQVVTQAVGQLAASHPGLTVRHGVVAGLPAQALIEGSREAELTVVGSRGLGGFTSLLLGSVSDQVAAHAPGPVVVVRGHAEASTGPVTVGTDGSAGGEYAVGVAFEEAARRGCAVSVVTAYSRPLSAPGFGMPPLVYDRDMLERDFMARLDQTVVPWREKYPDVAVHTGVVDGQAAHVLAEASARSQLVVVGSRGHGGFPHLPLGSVVRQLLHHASCPVMITRAP